MSPQLPNPDRITLAMTCFMRHYQDHPFWFFDNPVAATCPLCGKPAHPAPIR